MSQESKLSAAEPSHQSNAEYPILIIPGYIASCLYTKNGFKFWGGFGGIFTMFTHLPIKNKGYVKHNHTNQTETNPKAREYGSLKIHSELINRLCAEFPHRPVYFFSYDWRQSYYDSAELLDEEISWIIEKHSSKKVDVITHSMGGLLISAYAKKHGFGSLNTIITLAAPYEGTNQMYYTVLASLSERKNAAAVSDYPFIDNHSVNYSWLSNNFGFLWKKISPDFPSYFDVSVSDAYIAEFQAGNSPADRYKVNGAEMSLDDYAAVGTSVNASHFYRSQQFYHDIRAVLLKYDKSYFAYAQGYNTVSAVEFAVKPARCTASQRKLSVSRLIWRDGDQVVPVLSAVMLGKLFSLKPDRDHSFHANHITILKDSACIDWVLDILNSEQKA
ncbi:MAG TPA: alpha/beta hydrolase [Methanocorpusculum sp.]|nr:alpha/beta hydrolase [Methanocorpusculum sp.]